MTTCEAQLQSHNLAQPAAIRRALLMIGVAVLGQASGAQAATIAAASCNSAAVQTAFSQAAAGDTVTIPGGTCSWTSGISWSAPANVTVLGAGNLTVVGGSDATVIVDNSSSGTPLIAITTNSSGTFRLAGITVRGGTGSIKENGIVRIGGPSKQVRIDHNHINKSTYTPENNGKFMLLGGTLNGVVDHNLFTAGQNIGWIHIVNGSGSGDQAWASPTNFGTSDFLFIENNRLVGQADRGFSTPTYTATLTDCHTGGRYVARYNDIVGAAVGQTHPTGHAGHDRGCRAHELYGNIVTSTYNPQTEQSSFAFEYNNSGPAIVWGNSVDNQYKHIFVLNSIRKSNAIYGQSATPNGWGYCGTEFNGTGSLWDGNTNGTSGYPCLDQPGRGQGDLLSGDFPNQINTRTGGIAWPNQALEPIYEWQNVGSIAQGSGGSFIANQSPNQLAQNRDYYLYTSSFNGTGGVGSGPRASRPSSCTAGVAYWSTDQGGDWNTANGTTNDGTLDICTATNTWTNGVYKPFTFPHPLTSGVNPLRPSPPTTLSAN